MIYYNEIDKHAAAWCSELGKAGLIGQGVIDERSIAQVQGSDLAGYREAHFFAGIGGWPLALRLAAWPAGRPVWSGSCPCQPFSSAGKRKGEKDERHLWPEFRRLIAERLPSTIFGEQVASKDGKIWLARVRSDLEALGYRVGAADLCAASVGSPNIRQRLWWVANRDQGRLGERQELDGQSQQDSADRNTSGEYAGGRRPPREVGGVQGFGWDGRPDDEDGGRREHPSEHPGENGGLECGTGDRRGERRAESTGGGIAPRRLSGQLPDGQNADRWPGKRRAEEREGPSSQRRGRLKFGGEDDGLGMGSSSSSSSSSSSRAGRDSGAVLGAQEEGDREGGEYGTGRFRPLLAGPWSRYQLVYCADKKWRRLEPGLEPLATGIPGRVGLLRGYGNSINPWVAAEFIQAFLEAESDFAG